MQPNQIIQNYKLVRKLGEGGMGEVWLAEHLHMNRQVAVKALHSQFARNENIRKRFKQAVEVLSRLDHPGIVRVFDMVVTDDHLLMVMEFVEGMTLDEMIENVTGPMSEEQLRKLFPQMVQAIGYAHQHGVVHRDIKPSNFIVTRDGKVKVFDFDIAKLMNEEGQGLTKTGMRMGTLYYMSPEQVRGEKLDQRTDIYSLGMTLYVMATGKSPYAHMHSEFEVQTAIVNRAVPLPRSVYPGVSPKVEQMILRAIEKDPSRRLQTCEAFLSVNAGGGVTTPINKPISRPIGEAIQGVAAVIPSGLKWFLWVTIVLSSLSLLGVFNAFSKGQAFEGMVGLVFQGGFILTSAFALKGEQWSRIVIYILLSINSLLSLGYLLVGIGMAADGINAPIPEYPWQESPRSQIAGGIALSIFGLVSIAYVAWGWMVTTSNAATTYFRGYLTHSSSK